MKAGRDFPISKNQRNSFRDIRNSFTDIRNFPVCSKTFLKGLPNGKHVMSPFLDLEKAYYTTLRNEGVKYPYDIDL